MNVEYKLIQGNPDLNFLDQNPQLKYKDFFQDLFSRYPKEFSKLCWTLYYLEFPESPFYNAPEEVRKREIQKNYCPELDWRLVEENRRAFILTTMAKEKVLYKIAYDKLEELTMNLRDKDLENESEWKQVVSLLEKLDKMWTSMEMIRAKFVEAESISKVRGGGTESSRESRSG